MKMCATCKENKSLTEFYRNKTKSDGFTSSCKICVKKNAVDHRRSRNAIDGEACARCLNPLLRGKKYCSKKCLYESGDAGPTAFKKGQRPWNKDTGFTPKQHKARFYQRHKTRLAIKQRALFLKNKDKYLLRMKKWAAKNKDKIRVVKQRWRKNNLAAVNSFGAQRRALMLAAQVENADKEKIKQFYILAETLTIQTGIKYTVDHIQPLTKGGKHHHDNLQVITMSDNSKKGARYPYEVENKFFPTSV